MAVLPLTGRRPVIALAALLSGCLVALSVQVRRPDGHTVAEGWALDGFGIGLRMITGTRDAVRSISGWGASRASLEARNARLEAKTVELERELLVLRDAERERRRLLELTGTHSRAPSGSRIARMVSLVTAGPFHSGLLDQGRSAGLEANGVVVGVHGLLGRIVGVGESTARVQLLSDRLAALGVVLPRSGRVAVARGSGTGSISVEYVPVVADVAAGDQVVTSGTDGIYPKDLVVGVIETVRRGGGSLFLELPVKLAAEPEREPAVFVFPPVAAPEPGSEPTLLAPSLRSPRIGRRSP